MKRMKDEAARVEIDNEDIADALLEAPSCDHAAAAEYLSHLAGIHIPQTLVAERIKASKYLQRKQQAAQEAHQLEKRIEAELEDRAACAAVGDEDISVAFREKWRTRTEVAEYLAQKTGGRITRRAVSTRIDASPRLQAAEASAYQHHFLSALRAAEEAKRLRLAQRPRCGAPTREGGTCRRPVPSESDRCASHRDTPR